MWVTGVCCCSQQQQPILETSIKVKFLANFLCLGQSWSLGRAVGKEENGKGSCYVQAHELDITCPSEWEPHLPPCWTRAIVPKSQHQNYNSFELSLISKILLVFFEAGSISPILLADGQVLCASYKIRKLTLNSHLQDYFLPNTGCLARITFFPLILHNPFLNGSSLAMLRMIYTQEQQSEEFSWHGPKSKKERECEV